MTQITTSGRSGQNRMAQIKLFLLLAVMSGVSMLLYLGASVSSGGTGFPLDDAWIHQSYARNLARDGEWAFTPGIVSAGSTAPLWSLLLAVGHWLRIGPYPVTFIFGFLSLVGVGWLGTLYMKRAAPVLDRFALWAAGLLAFEWHLVWAAGSGMETLLAALLVLMVFTELARTEKRWARLGVLVGLGAWLRPDVLTLALPVGLNLWFEQTSWRKRVVAGVWFMAGALALLIPYSIFIRQTSGAWWPNTFYAKQAEYQIMQAAPFWKRFLQQCLQPLVGVGALLLPGVAYATWEWVRQRQWSRLIPLAWALSYLALFAWRLPVTYQHGRYQMPVMPVVWLTGLMGLVEVINRAQRPGIPRLLARTWMSSCAVLLFAFWVLGARAYVQDVRLIESEMVASARWIAANTRPEARVAAHDIGALGYFGERPLLDLAGLVNPEVIVFIRDEAQLARYLDEQGAEYLVTFPGWYPKLVKDLPVVYVTYGEVAPRIGGENMHIYRWSR